MNMGIFYLIYNKGMLTVFLLELSYIILNNLIYLWPSA